MISPERQEILQLGFVALLGKYNITPADAYPIFDRLIAAYAEPQRYYHNLEHIAEMLKVVGRLADTAANLPAVQLAVWFHDAVYDPKAKDNEARSAQLAVELLQPLGIPTPTLDHVATLINATAHGTPAEIDADTAVLLDADLAILAAEEKRYRRYASAIRQEYVWVEEEAYRTGRAQVLANFLARPRIYLTERMFVAAEEAARVNMAAEIESLKDKKN
jgi:predicted metal-dependent HD superfamily phosphohydrolase